MAFDMRGMMAQNPGDKWAGYGGYFRGMMDDPSMLGYSPDGMNAMRATAMGSLTGARKSTMQDVNRQIAAQGMGNTGMGIRSAERVGRDFMNQSRMLSNDVTLADEEARKRDFWQAAQGWGQGIQGQGGFQNQSRALNMQQPQGGFWGGVRNVMGGIKSILNP
jgi:hypothetical protein